LDERSFHQVGDDGEEEMWKGGRLRGRRRKRKVVMEKRLEEDLLNRRYLCLRGRIEEEEELHGVEEES